MANIHIDQEDFTLDEALVRDVSQKLDGAAPASAIPTLKQLHPADLADLLEFLRPELRGTMLDLLGDDIHPEILPYVNNALVADVVDRMGLVTAADAIAKLDSDDAIAVLEELRTEDQVTLIEALPLADRTIIEQGLAYPEGSAARLMQQEVVAVPDYWTVGQTIDYLRGSPSLPDDFYDVVVVDPRFRPVGSIKLSQVLRSRREQALTQLYDDKNQLVQPTTSREDVAYLFRQYGLTSAPVVSEQGRLMGVITVDDVVEVIREEADEDLLKLAGVADDDVFSSIRDTLKGRLPWLFLNLATAILASIVIAMFEGAIAKVTALAILMPIVASMGGNAGTQTLTVVIRALGVKDLSNANAGRLIQKEVYVGASNGLIFALTGAVLAGMWTGDVLIALVFALAMLASLIAGALAGVVLPLVIKKMGIDPAVASGVFLTTVTDVVGFATFLGLAVLMLV